MLHQILEQDCSEIKEKVREAKASRRRRLREKALERALKAPGVSAGERRLVESLAPLLVNGPLPISQRKLIDLFDLDFETIKRAVRRAIAHGFLCVDKTTKPHSYSLPDQWLTPAGS